MPNAQLVIGAVAVAIVSAGFTFLLVDPDHHIARMVQTAVVLAGVTLLYLLLDWRICKLAGVTHTMAHTESTILKVLSKHHLN